MEYYYNKSDIECDILELEVKKSSIIVSAIEAVTFSDPDVLVINFTSSLSSEEKTELDSIVNSHDGGTLKEYRMYCNVCEAYRCTDDIDTPTKCPNPECESSDIVEIVQQKICNELSDENGNDWGVFILSTGAMISARRF